MCKRCKSALYWENMVNTITKGGQRKVTQQTHQGHQLMLCVCVCARVQTIAALTLLQIEEELGQLGRRVRQAPFGLRRRGGTATAPLRQAVPTGSVARGAPQGLGSVRVGAAPALGGGGCGGLAQGRLAVCGLGGRGVVARGAGGAFAEGPARRKGGEGGVSESTCMFERTFFSDQQELEVEQVCLTCWSWWCCLL